VHNCYAYYSLLPNLDAGSALLQVPVCKRILNHMIIPSVTMAEQGQIDPTVAVHVPTSANNKTLSPPGLLIGFSRQFMARDCPSSSQASPTRQGDATLRFEQLGQDDTFLLGEHSYDNFLDGLNDEVSFAVPKFSDRYQTRPNQATGLPRLPVAEPVVLRAVSTPYGSRSRLIQEHFGPITHWDH
jgi:hypothetical protein